MLQQPLGFDSAMAACLLLAREWPKSALTFLIRVLIVLAAFTRFRPSQAAAQTDLETLKPPSRDNTFLTDGRRFPLYPRRRWRSVARLGIKDLLWSLKMELSKSLVKALSAGTPTGGS